MRDFPLEAPLALRQRLRGITRHRRDWNVSHYAVTVVFVVQVICDGRHHGYGSCHGICGYTGYGYGTGYGAG